MKKILIILTLILAAGMLFSETYSVTITSIPKTVEDFIAMRDTISKNPEGGAAMMIVALLIYSQDEALGSQCLVLAVGMDRLAEGNTYKGFALYKQDFDLIKSQLAKQKYMMKSYFKGATYDNNYTIPADNLVLEFLSTQYSGDKTKGTFKVFVFCGGADTPRPVTIQMNDKGIWKAIEWSSLIVGIKAIKSEKKPDNL